MSHNPTFITQFQQDTSKNILITTHKSPDGDAIGSTLGLYHFLVSQGFSPTVMVPDAFAHFLNWMPNANQIIIYDQDTPKANTIIAQADYIFCLDYNSFSRTGKMYEALKASKAEKFLIDHHQQPDIQAAYTLSETSASSTCELIYTFIQKHWPQSQIPLNSATCLYTGLMTDTGSFRFPSTSSYTHKVVAHLLDIGVKPAYIHEQVLDQNTANKLMLVGYALKNMEILKDLKTCIMGLTKEDLSSFNYQKGDTEGLVNYGLSIQGIRVSVLVIEIDNIIKISFRSKGNFSVHELAKTYFEGGGHTNAAGGQGKKSVAETIQNIKNVLAQKKDDIHA